LVKFFPEKQIIGDEESRWRGIAGRKQQGLRLAEALTFKTVEAKLLLFLGGLLCSFLFRCHVFLLEPSPLKVFEFEGPKSALPA
jgi:hypothetical protein